MYKTLKMDLVQTEGVKPTLGELEKFEDNPDSVDLDLDDRSSKVKLKKNTIFVKFFKISLKSSTQKNPGLMSCAYSMYIYLQKKS